MSDPTATTGSAGQDRVTDSAARWTGRRVLAVPIWQLCSLIDRLPWWFPQVGWERHGCLGCYPLRISRLAIKVEGL